MMNFNIFCNLKPLNVIYHHFHPLSDPNQEWGWLIRVGWWTLPTGLRPCSGGNSRWSPRNLKPVGNDSRGPRGPILEGLLLISHFDPSMISPSVQCCETPCTSWCVAPPWRSRSARPSPIKRISPSHLTFSAQMSIPLFCQFEVLYYRVSTNTWHPQNFLSIKYSIHPNYSKCQRFSMEIVWHLEYFRCIEYFILRKFWGVSSISGHPVTGCLRPLGFLALGLAEDVALGLLSENPSGLQSTPRGRLSTLGTALGHRFTWLPPRLFHRLSQT